MYMHTTRLVIESIKEKDAGSYKVMAINSEGSAESTASLLVSLGEGQSADYLSLARRSARSNERANNVAEQYELGSRLGVTGTPAIMFADGNMQPGYVPAAQLLNTLQQLAKG
jgi:protein-disulfide isomerase